MSDEIKDDEFEIKEDAVDDAEHIVPHIIAMAIKKGQQEKESDRKHIATIVRLRMSYCPDMITNQNLYQGCAKGRTFCLINGFSCSQPMCTQCYVPTMDEELSFKISNALFEATYGDDDE